MGVLYDYFRAPDAAAAAGAAERLGGPLTAGGADEPAFDGVDAKGIDPGVALGKLVALIRRVPWSVDIVSTTSVGPPDDDQFVEELAADVRDVLAAVDDARLPELAAAWARIEEFAGFTDVVPEWSQSLIEQFVGLARRAREAGERLYCWCSL